MVILNFGQDAKAFFDYPGVRETSEEYALMAVPPMKGVFNEQKYHRIAPMCTFLAVSDSDKAIGVAVAFESISNHMEQRVAVLESFYIDKAHRNTRAGWLLLNEVRSIAKEWGVDVFLASAQVGSGLDKYLSRKMKHFQNIYVEGLK